MAVLQVLVLGFVTFACSVSGQELTQSCNYTSDSSDWRLLSTAYLPSMIQCAVYCQQTRENIFSFQDGLCKVGTDIPETGVTTTMATAETITNAISSIETSATAVSIASTSTTLVATAVASTTTAAPSATTPSTTTAATTLTTATATPTTTTARTTTTTTTLTTATATPTTTTARTTTTTTTAASTTTTPTTTTVPTTTKSPISCSSSTQPFAFFISGYNVTKCSVNSQTIYFVTNKLESNSLTDTVAVCGGLLGLSGTVAKLDTAVKETVIQNVAKYLYPNITGMPEFWIGGRSTGTSWDWGFVITSAFSYTNWCNNVTPSVTSGNCATLKQLNGVLCWGWDTCTNLKPFICE